MIAREEVKTTIETLMLSQRAVTDGIQIKTPSRMIDVPEGMGVSEKIRYDYTSWDGKQKTEYITKEQYDVILKLKEAAREGNQHFKPVGYNPSAGYSGNIVELSERAGYKVSDAESAKTVSRILNDELNMQTKSFITTENGKHVTDTLEHHTLPSETTMGTTYTKPVRIELSTGKVTELDAVPASKETTTLSGSTKFPGVTETEARVLEQYEASGMDAATIQNAYEQLKKSHERVDEATTKVEITEKGGSKWSD